MLQQPPGRDGQTVGALVIRRVRENMEEAKQREEKYLNVMLRIFLLSRHTKRNIDHTVRKKR